MQAAATDKREIVRGIISEILEIEPTELTETSLFKEDHGADSLRSIEIMATLEKQFSIKIPEDHLPRMVNLEGVYAVVGECGGWA